MSLKCSPYTFIDHNCVRISHFSICATYTAHLILLDVFTLIVFGEKYYEIHNYIIFSVLVPLSSSKVQIFLSVGPQLS
jgi:hypothetical protein